MFWRIVLETGLVTWTKLSFILDKLNLSWMPEQMARFYGDREKFKNPHIHQTQRKWEGILMGFLINVEHQMFNGSK